MNGLTLCNDKHLFRASQNVLPLPHSTSVGEGAALVNISGRVGDYWQVPDIQTHLKILKTSWCYFS